jgi:hypothetical protein
MVEESTVTPGVLHQWTFMMNQTSTTMAARVLVENLLVLTMV